MQTQLPFFPEDITLINNYLGVQKKEDIVYYFNGMMPIYQHHKDDYDGFRLYTSQLVINGNCKQMDIVRCFGVSKESVKRWVKRCKNQKHLRNFVQKKSNSQSCTHRRDKSRNSIPPFTRGRYQ